MRLEKCVYCKLSIEKASNSLFAQFARNSLKHGCRRDEIIFYDLSSIEQKSRQYTKKLRSGSNQLKHDGNQ
jgi:hypothetical protein